MKLLELHRRNRLEFFRIGPRLDRRRLEYPVRHRGAAGDGGGLFLLVSGAGMNPVRANFLLTGITVVLSYFGHKYFSFRRRREHE